MKRLAPRGATLIDPETQVWRPVFGFDIDGTLGEYHRHFHWFAENWLGRMLPAASGYDGSVSFAKYLGISKPIYRKIKLAYRRGGLKRSMVEDTRMIRAVRQLHSRGAEIIICTTRPYLSLDNIDDDTRHWLKHRKVPHDGVIWGEHKYRELAKARPDRVLAVVDDLPEMVQQAWDLGLPPYLIKRNHNATHEDFFRHDVYGVQESLNDLLDAWEKENLK